MAISSRQKNELQDLKSLGISAVGARGVLPYSGRMQNGRLHIDNIDFAKAARDMLAMDSAATLTSPNVGAPAALYTFISPEIVNILYDAMNASRLLPFKKEGSFEQEYVTFPVEEFTGSVSPYSDYGDGTSSDVNYNYPTRQIFRYQTTIQYGDLETAKMAVARVQLAARKQAAAADIMARAENSFYLFGVKGMKIYGILNDPNLNAAITPISVTTSQGSGKTTWEDKAQDATQGANFIFNDIMKLWTEISANNGGLVDQNTRFVLAVSNKRMPLLSTANNYNVSVMTLLKNTLPNVDVVPIPELSASDGEEMLLIAQEVLGQDAGFCAFAEKYRAGRLVSDTASFRQKVSGATMGAVITHPSLIARMKGI